MKIICHLLLISCLTIVLIKSSPPRMKVDFGVNLPSMSFNLPSLNLPKMRITAVVNRVKPKKPIKIELPAVHLMAKSLEDSWGDDGYAEGDQGYQDENQDGWSASGDDGYGGEYEQDGYEKDGWSDGGKKQEYYEGDGKTEVSYEGNRNGGYSNDGGNYQHGGGYGPSVPQYIERPPYGDGNYGHSERAYQSKPYIEERYPIRQGGYGYNGPIKRRGYIREDHSSKAPRSFLAMKAPSIQYFTSDEGLTAPIREGKAGEQFATTEKIEKVTESKEEFKEDSDSDEDYFDDEPENKSNSTATQN